MNNTTILQGDRTRQDKKPTLHCLGTETATILLPHRRCRRYCRLPRDQPSLQATGFNVKEN